MTAQKSKGDREVEEGLRDEWIGRGRANPADRKPTGLDLMLSITQDISSILNLERLLETILLKLEIAFGHRHSMIQLVDLRSRELILLDCRGLSPDETKRQIRLGEGIIGTVALTGRPIRIPYLQEDP